MLKSFAGVGWVGIERRSLPVERSELEQGGKVVDFSRIFTRTPLQAKRSLDAFTQSTRTTTVCLSQQQYSSSQRHCFSRGALDDIQREAGWQKDGLSVSLICECIKTSSAVNEGFNKARWARFKSIMKAVHESLWLCNTRRSKRFR